MSGRSIEAIIEAWDGEAVATRFDRETGAWFFVALHDSTLGTPNGGTRMRVYDGPGAGLEDAMRLAEGMTRKWAVLGLPFGGGKAVLAVPERRSGSSGRAFSFATDASSRRSAARSRPASTWGRCPRTC